MKTIAIDYGISYVLCIKINEIYADKSIDNQLFRGKIGSSKHSMVATDVRGYLNNDNYLLVSDQFCGVCMIFDTK